jgi:hypothetical protein
LSEPPPPAALTRPTVPAEATTTTAPRPLVDAVAFVGDSLADDLATGLSRVASRFGIGVANAAISGCGVARSGDYRLGGRRRELSEICVDWVDTWTERLDRDRPKVVAVQVGRHEVLDRMHEGRWSNILEPAYAAYVREELAHAVAVASRFGSKVVLLTSPYFRASSSGRSEDDPARVDRFNAILREVAGSWGATVLDLGGRLSPGGAYSPVVDGVSVRSDGVHYSAAGVGLAAPYLMPPIADLIRMVPAFP